MAKRGTAWSATASLTLSVLMLVGMTGCDAIGGLFGARPGGLVPLTSIAVTVDGSGAHGSTPLLVLGPPEEHAGSVTATVARRADGDLILTVTYATTDGWEMTDSAVWVGDSDDDMPDCDLEDATSLTAVAGSTPLLRMHSINLTDQLLDVAGPDGLIPLFIAAQAQMRKPDSSPGSFDYSIPGSTVLISLSEPGAGGGYSTAALTGAGDLDGAYRAWCVDPSRHVPYNTSISMALLSSYSTAAYLDAMLGHPENLDLLNLLINTDLTTVLSPALLAQLDPLDVQVAIWQLIDPVMAGAVPETPHDPAVVQAILDFLFEYRRIHGVDNPFVPGEGQFVAVIADPNGLDPAGTMQVIIVELPVAGSDAREGIAWAQGTATDSGCAVYFEFDYYTEAEGDTEAPEVISTVPGDSASEVPTNWDITATFDEAMDAATISTTTFTVTGPGGAVAGSVTLSPSGTTAIFTPGIALTSGTTYTGTITSGAEDSAGNPLASPYEWSFTTSAGASQGTSPVILGTAGDWAILSKAGITNSGPSVVTGDIGVSPIAATAITGFDLVLDGSGQFSTSSQIVGRAYAADYSSPTPVYVHQAILDMEAAYTDAAGRAPNFIGLNGEVGGKTLDPGVYEWTGTDKDVSVSLGDLTLKGGANDVWIFQITGDVTMAAGKAVVLIGGALAKNVFWQVAGGAGVDLGAGAQFQGIALTATASTLKQGATVNGRLLAQTNVTLIQNDVARPTP